MRIPVLLALTLIALAACAPKTPPTTENPYIALTVTGHHWQVVQQVETLVAIERTAVNKASVPQGAFDVREEVFRSKDFRLDARCTRVEEPGDAQWECIRQRYNLLVWQNNADLRQTTTGVNRTGPRPTPQFEPDDCPDDALREGCQRLGNVQTFFTLRLNEANRDEPDYRCNVDETRWTESVVGTTLYAERQTDGRFWCNNLSTEPPA